MVLTNADIDGAWTLQSKNTALQGRLHDGGLWSQANVQNSALTPMIVWRAGVVPSSSFNSTYYDLVVAQTGSASLSLLVYPGTGVVSRAANAVYQAYNSAVRTVTVANADPTNPRLDAIVLRVEDTALGDGALRGQIQVITGVPGAVPALPAIPAGSIILFSARVNALATTITNAQLTDLRKSVCLNGGVRRLLPGDSLADVGFRNGELRDTGSSIDRWTDATSTWVPVAVVPRVFEGRLTVLSAVGGEADVPSCTTTFTTRDANTKVLVTANLKVSSVPNTHYIQGKINVDGANVARDFFADQHGSLGPGNGMISFPWTLPAAGSHTIKLRAISSNGGNAEADSTGISVEVLGP